MGTYEKNTVADQQVDGADGAMLCTRIEVEDNGAGMDGWRCEQIFNPFLRTKPFDQEIGLGLSTVYGIVHSIAVGSNARKASQGPLRHTCY